MSGPWDDYQSGPWTAFSASKADPVTTTRVSRRDMLDLALGPRLQGARKAEAAQNNKLIDPSALFDSPGGMSLNPVELILGMTAIATKSKPAQIKRSLIQGQTFGFGDELVGAAAAGQDLINSLLTGRQPAPRTAYSAAVQAHREQLGSFARSHPVTNAVTTVAGGLAAPGASAAADFIGQAPNLGGAMLRSGAAGAAMGALGGAGSSEGDLASRAGGAAKGAAIGGAVGAAVPVATRTVDLLIGGPGRLVARAANKISGGRLLDNSEESLSRLAGALRADGVDESDIATALQNWRDTGASDPAFMNLAGENTRALIRSSASKPGAARNMAVQHADQVTADLQDAMVGRTADLTPDTRTTTQLDEALRTARSNAAGPMYDAMRDIKVPVGDDVMSAIHLDTGRTGINYAADLADAERNTPVLQELQALSEGRPKEISAGTLDYVRRGFREAAAAANRRGEMQTARALGSRAQDLETALNDVPGWNEARSTYRGFSRRIDAIDLGKSFLASSKKPEEFAQQVYSLPAEARDSARVGARQAIQEALGDRKAGSLELLSKIASGTNMKRNLTALFGEDEASGYIAAASNELKKVGQARFISPNTGSQTATRTADDLLIDALSNVTSPKTAGFKLLLSKLRAGATLTDAERAEIVRLGLAPPEETLAALASRKVSTPNYGRRITPPLSILLTNRPPQTAN